MAGYNGEEELQKLRVEIIRLKEQAEDEWRSATDKRMDGLKFDVAAMKECLQKLSPSIEKVVGNTITPSHDRRIHDCEQYIADEKTKTGTFREWKIAWLGILGVALVQLWQYLSSSK
jgi:hypothetical protein